MALWRAASTLLKPSSGTRLTAGGIAPNGGFWLFNEGLNAGSFADASGQNAPGTISGAVEVVQGPFGGPALRFTSNTTFINLGLLGKDIGNGPFTVVAWCKGAAGTVFYKGDGNTISAGVWGTFLGSSSELFLERSVQNQQFVALTGGDASQWMQVAWVWDGTLDTSSPLVHSRIFVNGAPAANSGNTVGSGTRGSTATFPLKIGTNGGGGTNTTDLAIDHILLDRRAYSDGEVLEWYRNPFRAFARSGSQISLPGPPPDNPPFNGGARVSEAARISWLPPAPPPPSRTIYLAAPISGPAPQPSPTNGGASIPEAVLISWLPPAPPQPSITINLVPPISGPAPQPPPTNGGASIPEAVLISWLPRPPAAPRSPLPTLPMGPVAAVPAAGPQDALRAILDSWRDLPWHLPPLPNFAPTIPLVPPDNPPFMGGAKVPAAVLVGWLPPPPWPPGEILEQRRRFPPPLRDLVLTIGKITTLPESADTFLMAGWISELSLGESFNLISDIGLAGIAVSVSSIEPRFTAWTISAWDVVGVSIFNAMFSVPLDLTEGWHTYAISVQVSSGTLQLLGDQRLFTPSITFASSNPVAYFPASDPWQIGPVMGHGGGVEIANLRFHAGEPFFDLAIRANVARLFGPRNQPVSWGSDGATVTGIQPAVFLTGDARGFPHNAGTGGGWSINGGVLTDAPGPL